MDHERIQSRVAESSPLNHKVSSYDPDDSVNSLVFGNDIEANDVSETQEDVPGDLETQKIAEISISKENIVENVYQGITITKSQDIDNPEMPTQADQTNGTPTQKIGFTDETTNYDILSKKNGKNVKSPSPQNFTNQTYGVLQDDISDTPFLNKLKDPFNDTYGSNDTRDMTPQDNEIKNGVGDPFVVPNKRKPGTTIFSKIRQEADESPLKYESQPQTIDDTQQLEGSIKNDKSMLLSPPFDTQQVIRFSQSNAKDTQVVSTLSPPHINGNSKNIEDNNSVGNNVDNSNNYNNNSTNNNNTNDSTQIDNKSLAYSLNDTQKTSHTNDVTMLTFSTADALVQIPETSENETESHRQVISTQEMLEMSMNIDHNELETQMIQEVDKLEVISDEELYDNVNVDVEDSSDGRIALDNQVEDSLITHRLKRKYASSVSGSPQKRRQSAESESANRRIQSAGGSLEVRKSPLALLKYNEPTLDTSSGIADSSPVVRRSDILKLNVNQSSPSKEANQSIRSDHVIDSDLTNDEFPNLSSPRFAEGPAKAEQEEEMEESEMEDVDMDSQAIVIDAQRQSTVINTRRRRNHVIDTQSQENVEVANDTSGDSSGTSYRKDSADRNDGILRHEASDVLTESDILFRDSVWASYNLKMYSGVVVERQFDVSKVEFVEGLYEIKNSDLYLLDIRIGDMVKTKYSNVKYVVTGLTNTSSSTAIKCVRGYNYLLLQKRSVTKKPQDEIGVSLSECYIEVEDWFQRQQKYSLVLDEKKIPNGNDVLRTPSKPRLAAMPGDSKYKAGPFSSPIRDGSRLSPQKSISIFEPNKIFSGMLFCITSIEGASNTNITKLIEDNGGTLIQKGFKDMLEYQVDVEGLSLKPKSKSLEKLIFAAVISNNHCRSAKYLEALALGWPILSDAFILDCVEDESRLSKWPSYLLPAGHSIQMNSVKSIDVFEFRYNYEMKKSLKEQIHIHSELLRDFNIVVHNYKINPTTLRTCQFIFYAFGAHKLEYCTREPEVMKTLKKMAGDTNEVMIYDDGPSTKTKLQSLEKKRAEPVEPTRSTRTRSSRIKSQSLKATKAGSQSKTVHVKVSVINWEWVVQCVISGIIWDTETFNIDI
ncbi:predicted protein [Scheffersomyces stipitis CBS 6054]|uniref:BRCT domain-containing protein n=1 Tax=Scheffersomyces stipitis (strain ATCC 58785 / CBS 6054 / NBRC 10063 / NRRL Y-11545) TaxID=322104 RepID=A3LVP6_PICST|nr:predicted protein [Scheffersomyces stipitis CBS 6054]ABN66816.2 predicted protein [Scheffersomyces stipitis CBS 6054]KAG2734528.1 hypothetical protein G9P44_002534 [Scheffersomyces stipitis]